MSQPNSPPDPTGGDDDALVRRFRQGDHVAFRALYEFHHRRVFALALRLTASREEAEEVTQDTFVTAWRQRAAFRAEAAVSTWLHGIALRLCRQRWRGLLRRRRRDERHGRESYRQTVERAMPGARLDLEVALTTLPPRMRTAVVLHKVEGYTMAETASLMGIADGTVKTHVYRALTLLKQRLGDGSWTA